jgi:mycothiol synthase
LLKIRPFRKGFDEEAFVRLYNTCFGDYDDIRSMTLEEVEKIEESPGFSAEGMLIGEWNGENAAMVNAYVDKQREERKGFIQWLAVLPQFRKKGIARKLIAEALQSLKKRGMTRVETWAQSDRKECISLFESFGFEKARVMNMMKRSLTDLPTDIGKKEKVTIRDMQMTNEEDIKLLNRLDNETFKEHFNFRPRTIDETKYQLFEAPWFQKQEWFFAILNNESIGFSGVAIDEGLNSEKNLKWGWILDIGVLKPYRRKGIGARLMLHGLHLLKDEGMKHVVLYVDEDNPTKAIRLYEKLGFTIARENLIYQLSLEQ